MYTERCIVFAIDAEPDGRKRIQGDEWEGTQVALRELAQLRSRIEELSQTPVRLNWFLRFDPQIEATWGRPDWVLEAWPSLIQWIERYGDFTGIHTHFGNGTIIGASGSTISATLAGARNAFAEEWRATVRFSACVRWRAAWAIAGWRAI